VDNETALTIDVSMDKRQPVQSINVDKGHVTLSEDSGQDCQAFVEVSSRVALE